MKLIHRQSPLKIDFTVFGKAIGVFVCRMRAPVFGGLPESEVVGEDVDDFTFALVAEVGVVAVCVFFPPVACDVVGSDGGVGVVKDGDDLDVRAVGLVAENDIEFIFLGAEEVVFSAPVIEDEPDHRVKFFFEAQLAHLVVLVEADASDISLGVAAADFLEGLAVAGHFLNVDGVVLVLDRAAADLVAVVEFARDVVDSDDRFARIPGWRFGLATEQVL